MTTATMIRDVEGYSLKGEKVEVLKKIGSCYHVKNERGYIFIALPSKIQLDDENYFKENECEECGLFENKHKYSCSVVQVETE